MASSLTNPELLTASFFDDSTAYAGNNFPYAALPYTNPDPSSASRLQRPRHTLQDLLAIQLNPTNRPIRLTFDEHPAPKPVDIDARIKDSFLKYTKLRKPLIPWYKTTLTSPWDKFRFALHLKLLQWKVIV